MPKKTSKQTNKNLNPLTIEQLKKIQQLRRQIKSHTRHINRFTSMAVTAVTLPLLVTLMYKYTGLEEYISNYLRLKSGDVIDKLQISTLIREIYKNSNEVFTTEDGVVINAEEVINFFDQLFPTDSIKDLYDRAGTEFQRDIYQQGHQYVSKLVSGILMNKTIFVSEIVFSMIIQYLIVDSVLNRLFPYGIFGASLNSEPERQVLTQQDYSEVSQLLENLEKELGLQAEVNIKRARYGLAVVAPLVLMLLITEQSSPIAIIVAFTLIATALTNASKDLSSYYEKKSLPHKLQQQEKLIKIATGNHRRSLQRNEGTDFNSSGFVVEFKQFEKDKEVLSAKKVAALFKECCIYHQVDVDDQQGSSVSLPARSKLSNAKAEAVQGLFSKSIDRLISIRKYSKQMENLQKKLGEWNSSLIYFHYSDENHLPTIRFELSFSRSMPPKIFQMCKDLFSKNCQIIESKNNYTLKIADLSSIEANKLAELESIIKNAAKQPAMSVQQMEELLEGTPGQKSHITRNPELTASISNNNSKSEELSSEEKKVRVVKWKAGFYNSQAKDNKIVPVSTGKIRDAQTEENAKFFIKDELDYDLIKPASLADEVKKKVESMMADPHFAPSKGHQGLIFWQSHEKDQHNKWIKTDGKIKLLGEFSDTRLYLESEKAEETDETLFKIKGINFKAHK